MKTNVEIINPKKTGLFTNYIYRAIPLAFDESMSYYETLCGLLEYLRNTIIPTINHNAEAIIEFEDNVSDEIQTFETNINQSFNNLSDEVSDFETNITNLYNQLHDYVEHYFDNLDVQEEINNKLDQMAEDGTLSELLGQYRDTVHIKELGCVGDGTTDNSTLLQEIFNTYRNIFIDDGEYYASENIYINSNTKIYGNGTLKCNVYIQGEESETITYSTLEVNKINTDYVFNINDLLKIYYEEDVDNTNNKRQMVTTSSTDGKLSNNLLNYSDSYTIKKINSKKNIYINDIYINGTLNISYSQDIYVNNLNLTNGSVYVSYSYNVNIQNSSFILSNGMKVDARQGSSNLLFKNLKFMGGNTVSDNSALKLNEVFYSNIEDINFGTPNNDEVGYTGYFHALMIDGNFAEDNYPLNPSQYINAKNIFVANGYSNSFFITLTKNINIDNINGVMFHIKNSDNININDSILNDLYNETNVTNLNIVNSKLNNIKTGSRKNMKIVNCTIDEFALASGTDNIKLINCIINKFKNTYVTSDSAHNIMIENCEILGECNLSGIDKCIAKIISHVNVSINQLNNSNVDILIVENATSHSNNISMQSCVNTKIFYQIVDSALATTPVNNLLDGLSTKVETVRQTTANNLNNNISQSILKSSASPATGNHYKGEIVLNTSPASGGPIGWVCVGSGEPGTWKEFGTISS